MKTIFLRQWLGHPVDLKAQGEPIGWFPVQKKEALDPLKGNVREFNGTESTPEQIEKKLISGHILQSSAAMYIAFEEKGGE